MALDHYVSQVHLKQFAGENPAGMLRAYRKTDLKIFNARPKDVCRTQDGNTTEYLREPRAVESFLRDVEPAYDRSLDKIRAGEIDETGIYSIAGFTSFVDCCSPGGIRIHTQPLKAMLRNTAVMLDQQGEADRAPSALDNKTLTELITEGRVDFKVDEKYPQAVGIATLLGRLSVFGNSYWDVLENPHPDVPFLTSDFPIAIEFPSTAENFSRVAPLAKDIAVRIVPDPNLRGAPPDLSFPHLRISRIVLSTDEVMELNRQIVRCAETVVFSSIAADWVDDLVRENQFHRIDAIMTTLPMRRGLATVATMKVVDHRPNDVAQALQL